MLTDPLADNESEGDLSAGRSNKLLQSTQSIVNPAELDESLLMYEKKSEKRSLLSATKLLMQSLGRALNRCERRHKENLSFETENQTDLSRKLPL